MIKQDILLTVDSVVYTIINEKLQVLLIKRLVDPYKESWAIPWGFVLETETLEQAAYRELMEETNVKNIYLEQLYSFSDIDRDPRWRVVSVAYMAVINNKNLSLKAWTDAKEVKFFPIDRLPKLAFDHKNILNYAYTRLKWKLEYTNIAQYFLPEKFTFSDFYNIYSIIFQKEFDIRNFKKKIEKLWIIEETGEIQIWVKHRPAKLFQFVNKELSIVEVL